MALTKFPAELRLAFEESLAPTLALWTEKDDSGHYVSPKTGNLFLAFCYGWYRGEGTLKELPALLAEIRRRVE